MTVAARAVFLISLTAGLASCGGGGGRSVSHEVPVKAFSTGPVYNACMTSGRSAASPTTCGCVQATADSTLSSSDQRRAVKFFKDPHMAQETRQSDNPMLEAFWLRYKDFATRAEQTCA